MHMRAQSRDGKHDIPHTCAQTHTHTHTHTHAERKKTANADANHVVDEITILLIKFLTLLHCIHLIKRFHVEGSPVHTLRRQFVVDSFKPFIANDFNVSCSVDVIEFFRGLFITRL